jgi:phosphoheptose isomerase
VCGNGGSAAIASHFACDIVKGASFNRCSRFRIMALTDQLATLTAYANDVGHDAVFVEQLKNFAQPGDLFMGIGSSGNSPNAAAPWITPISSAAARSPSLAAMAASSALRPSSTSRCPCPTWAASKMPT